MLTVRGTLGNVHDVTEGCSLLQGQESVFFGEAGYVDIEKPPDAKTHVKWHIAAQPGKRKAAGQGPIQPMCPSTGLRS